MGCIPSCAGSSLSSFDPSSFSDPSSPSSFVHRYHSHSTQSSGASARSHTHREGEEAFDAQLQMALVQSLISDALVPGDGKTIKLAILTLLEADDLIIRKYSRDQPPTTVTTPTSSSVSPALNFLNNKSQGSKSPTLSTPSKSASVSPILLTPKNSNININSNKKIENEEHIVVAFTSPVSVINLEPVKITNKQERKQVLFCDENEECSICWDDFTQNDLIITLPCDPSHTFHATCIREWLTCKSSLCPNCRHDARIKTPNRKSSSIDGLDEKGKEGADESALGSIRRRAAHASSAALVSGAIFLAQATIITTHNIIRRRNNTIQVVPIIEGA